MTLKRSVVLSLLLGGICAGFRYSVWQVAYDSDAQLITAPRLVAMSNLFSGLCLLVIGLLFAVRHRKGIAAPAPYPSKTPIRRILRLASVCCSIAAGVLLLREQWGVAPAPYMALILGALFLLQGAAQLLLTLWKNTDSKRYATLLLLPTFSGCYWLVAFYHEFGSSPNRETYLWPTIAGILVAAAWLSYASFTYERPKGTFFALFSLLALPVILLAVTAPLPLSYRLSLLGQLAWLWAALLTLKFQPIGTEENADTQNTETIEEGESPCPKN